MSKAVSVEKGPYWPVRPSSDTAQVDHTTSLWQLLLEPGDHSCGRTRKYLDELVIDLGPRAGCSDIRDKIYGFLSLAAPICQTNRTRQMVVDYGSSTLVTYMRLLASISTYLLDLTKARLLFDVLELDDDSDDQLLELYANGSIPEDLDGVSFRIAEQLIGTLTDISNLSEDPTQSRDAKSHGLLFGVSRYHDRLSTDDPERKRCDRYDAVDSVCVTGNSAKQGDDVYQIMGTRVLAVRRLTHQQERQGHSLPDFSYCAGFVATDQTSESLRSASASLMQLEPRLPDGADCGLQSLNKSQPIWRSVGFSGVMALLKHVISPHDEFNYLDRCRSSDCNFRML
jgi:hypothetical protein